MIDKLKRRSKNFVYSEAESLLISFGFTKSNKGKTSGSRVVFIKDSIRIEIHKPQPQKELKPYQITDLLSELMKGGFI